MKTNGIIGAELYRERHGDAPGVRSPRKRRAGARRGFAPLAVLLALVMALAFPARAFASIYNNPQVQWTSAQSCVVSGPNNEFDAALAIIERTNTKIQISEPMFVELSNEGTGGRFYQLAKSLKCAADETPGLSNFVLNATVSASVMLCGADYVWWQDGIAVSGDLISGALQDYDTIRNGGHLGGGGSISGDNVSYTAEVFYASSTTDRIWLYGTDGTRYTNRPRDLLDYSTARLLPSTINVLVPKSLYSLTHFDSRTTSRIVP